MDFSIITWDVFLKMLGAFRVSLIAAVLICIFGTLLGIAGAAMKLSRSRILHAISTVYVEIFRGTPMLVQIHCLSGGSRSGEGDYRQLCPL